MLFQPGQKIVLIGDSITDAGRTDSAGPYGNGYVNLVRSLLMARYPAHHLTFVNKGSGGNTVRDLAARWEQDVIAEQPDWLSINVGINDAYREIPLAEYTSTLRTLLNQTYAAKNTYFILMQPYLIEPDRTDWERIRMDQYRAAMLSLATDYHAVLVNTQAAFDTVLTQTSPTDWSHDRVHPDLPGHVVLAMAFLNAIKFTWS